MAQNKNLHTAKKAKNDEFYTQLSDIEKECYHYREHFRNKVIYCNCDDARESNFFKYFAMNFELFGLKKLITTGFKADGKGVCLVYEGDKNGNRIADDCEIQVTELQGNGDFRSEECIELLKQADMVVTNPPFSLFREYVAQLVEYDKKFLIIGNMNAITFKEIFPLIKENKLWLGVNEKGGSRKGNSLSFINNGEVKDVSSWWYTNMDNKRRNEELILYKQYSIDDYPKYDNYDAIECGRSREIPCDYDKVIGVPISFLMFHNPSQFQIIGFFNNYKPETADVENGQIYGNAVKIATTKSLFRGPVVNGKATYFRILIKKK